ncbi:MAG: RagB/SusD family nutrient uptake outer membrane protein [Prolixibacteraceae bacterium]
MNRITYLVGSILLILIASGCDPLGKENLTAISNDDVYTIPEVAEAYVNDIYANFMPGFDVNEGANCDEAMQGTNVALISGYLNGTITADSYDYQPYSEIRSINIFLAGIENATFDTAVKGRLKGEALFWRAWAYFKMVRAYGGVPLILVPQSPDEGEAVFTPRSTTSACFTQIIKDLDDAIALLPDPTGNGRIDKGVAMAFKGRVTLFHASPQFNRSNNLQLWQAAYDANDAAVTYLDGKGKGLMENFSEIWTNEMSKEVIMVRRYAYPEATNGYSQVCVMPLKYGESGCAHGNQPSLELVNAFPMKDGSKWDPESMDYTALFENRDDRFYYTIAYNGAAPYLKPMFGKENMWTYFYDKDGNPSTGVNGKEIRADFIDGYESLSGFYTPKMMDPTLDATNKLDGQIDWIEIRYAEVIMNLAEAANEVNKPGEALQILGRIRNRAGIEAGTNGKYGITATTKDGIRQTIMDERFAEFAFETKRFWDLRRWRIYKSHMEGLEGGNRHGLRVEWDGTTANRPTGLEDINQIWNQFSASVVDDTQPITMLSEDKYSFFGIPSSYLERNSKLEQNNSWGGTFDPLE